MNAILFAPGIAVMHRLAGLVSRFRIASDAAAAPAPQAYAPRAPVAMPPQRRIRG